jgi:hypothetical protein
MQRADNEEKTGRVAAARVQGRKRPGWASDTNIAEQEFRCAAQKNQRVQRNKQSRYASSVAPLHRLQRPQGSAIQHVE